MRPRKLDYHEILRTWGGSEPDWRLYKALGTIACGQMAGMLVGDMLLVPIGKRVFQLLEIAVEEGIALSAKERG